MHWQAQSRPRVDLSKKLDRIQITLERFREAPPRKGLSWEVGVILSYVHSHLFESGLNATAVRRGCNLRDNSISSRFRYAVGLGLKEYIETNRMRAVQTLLRDPDLEIYLIAMSVGYDHQETFFRAFQRHTGCTPSQWRLAALTEGSTASSSQPIVRENRTSRKNVTNDCQFLGCLAQHTKRRNGEARDMAGIKTVSKGYKR